MLATRMVLAVYVVNACYGFEGSLTRLGDYEFVSTTLRGSDAAMQSVGNRFADCWLRAVPVPFPKNYIAGLDVQRRDFESSPQISYLRGQFSEHGWWYYYLYALAVKVPLGVWMLTGLSLASLWVTRYGRACDELVLVLPAVLLLAFVSSQTGFSTHFRYALPIFPLWFVWIGRVAPLTLDYKHRLWGAATASALAWSVGSTLWIYPHTLSYFNELAGGPMNGSQHLIHSNLDWGQDLFYLKQWLTGHPEHGDLTLAYFGYFDPRQAGVECQFPQSAQATIHPGWYAVSINLVRGLPWNAYRDEVPT